MSRDPVELDNTTKGKIADQFRGSKDMFSLLEGHRVDGKIDNPFVIGGEDGGSLGRMAEIGEKFTKE